MQTPVSISQELRFLAEVTGEEESVLLHRALTLGLNQLYRTTAEQAYIDEQLTRDEALTILGPERIAELDYARQALAADVARGLAR